MQCFDEADRRHRRKIMKLHKVLPMIVAALATVFVVQVAVRYHDKPEPVYFASWKDDPKDIADAKRLARKIVTGVVTKVERGQDLVIKAAGEPNGEDRIPIEVVTLKVEKAHKGGNPEYLQVFRTGGTKDPKLVDRPAPPMDKAPPKPKGAVERPAKLPKPTEAEARTVLLEDDPPYKMGERKLLFLTDGPAVMVAGKSVKTQRLIAPQGRFNVKADNKLEPIVAKGFAAPLRGKALPELEGLLK
jgi:hypothetical protein